MEEPKKSLRFSPRVETRLASADIKRLETAAEKAGQTRAEFTRQALLWYLDNLENLEHDKRETEVAQAMRYATDQHVKAINSGVDRICKMLARQGRAVGTLYELAWMSLPDDDNARAAFDIAVQSAKQKMAKHVEKDEQELADRMKKVVKG
jgi:predicted DNA-binding protein